MISCILARIVKNETACMFLMIKLHLWRQSFANMNFILNQASFFILLYSHFLNFQVYAHVQSLVWSSLVKLRFFACSSLEDLEQMSIFDLKRDWSYDLDPWLVFLRWFREPVQNRTGFIKSNRSKLIIFQVCKVNILLWTCWVHQII